MFAKTRGVDYAGDVPPPPHFFGQVCLYKDFQEPVWINIDLNSKRQDSLCMTWCFIRTQNDEHPWALNIRYMQCKFQT